MAEALRHGLGAEQLVGTERLRNRRLEDIEVARIGRMAEQRRRRAEIFAQHLGRHVLEPVAQQESAVLVEVAVVEDQEELAPVGIEPLDRMGNAAGKIPEIADADIVDEIPALRVDRGDAGRSIEHVGPFRLLVPVQLAHAARVQPHIDAGDATSKRRAPGPSPGASSRRSTAGHARRRRKTADWASSRNRSPEG